MRDTIISIAGNPSWKQRTPLQIGDERLATRCRQLAQMHLIRSLARDAVTILVQNGGRSQAFQFTRAQLRAERGYRAFYYWDE